MNEESKDKELFAKLSCLLRKSGDHILNGSSKLSLTTTSLVLLNDGFEEIRDEDFTTSFEVVLGNIPTLPDSYHNLQFLYDFVQKTPRLKIIHSGSTLQGSVSVATFRNLNELEIKKAPVHLIEGLHKLKGRLQTLICTKCVSRIYEVFETCGSDQSAPSIWPGLTSIFLGFNMIEELDSSLRLLPDVSIFDISHNNIRDAENFLEYLTDLTVMNLGYNCLETVPTFAVSCRSSLRTLVLRNNYLEHIDGLGELAGLQDLDLSNNCICDHLYLHPLHKLNRLDTLQLAGNPLCYHKNHRCLTVKHLHPQAAKKIILDGQALSKREQSNISGLGYITPKPNRQLLINDPGGGYSSLEQSYSSQHFVHNTTETSATPDESDKGMVSSSSSKKKGKGKRTRSSRRVRAVEISDMDVGSSTAEATTSADEMSSYQESTPVSNDHQQMKQEVEQMRSQLGPDWLYSLTVQKRTNKNTAQTKSTNRNMPFQSETSNLDNASFKSANVEEGSFKSFDHIPATEDDIYLTETNPDNEDPEKVKPSLSRPVQDTQPHDRSLSTTNSSSDIIIVDDNDNMEKKSRERQISQSSSKSEEQVNIYSTRKHSNIEVKDYGAESEPFIVRVYGEEEDYIVSVAERYILQKDIGGDVVDTLDLAGIKTAILYEEGNEVLVRLLFDTIRKDRKERKYVMEDANNAQEFYDLLKPIVEVKENEAKYKDCLQCLKCGEEFRKTQAKRHVRQSSLGSGNDVNTEKADLTEGLSCPKCHSKMVMELDPAQIAQVKGGGSSYNTPMGSFNPTSHTLSPLATSSAFTTPRKDEDETDCSDVFKSTRSKESATLTEASSYKSCMTDISSSFKSIDENTLSQNQPKKQLFGSSESKLQKSSSSAAITRTDASMANGYVGLKKNFSAQDVDSTKKSSWNGGLLDSSSSPASDSTLVNKDSVVASKKMLRESGSDILVLKNPSHQKHDDTDHEGSTGNSRNENGFVGNSSSEHNGSNSPASSSIKQPIRESGSDLLILNNPSQREVGQVGSFQNSIQRPRPRRHSSDIEIITPTSHTTELSTAVEEDIYATNKRTVGETELSPCGSLTNRTVSAMVDHMYKSVYSTDGSQSGEVPTVYGSLGNSSVGFSVPGDDNQSMESFHSATGKDSDIGTVEIAFDAAASVQKSGITYNNSDFSQVDHRLKLYFMMSLFADDNEEFQLVLKCGMVQHSKGEEFQGLMVMSSAKIYLLKVKKHDSTDSPDTWLRLFYTGKLLELQYVDIGIQYQTLRIEFGGKADTFTLLLRDQARCKMFVAQFTRRLRPISESSKSRLQGISKNSSVTLDAMEELLQASLYHCESGTELDAAEISQDRLVVMMGYLRTGQVEATGEDACSPVTMLLTTSHLCLAHENLATLDCLSAPNTMPTKPRFHYKDRHRLTDITSLDLYRDLPLEIGIHFLDETTNEEVSWCIVMETKEALASLVKSIREPWEEVFGVEMDINTIDAIV